MTISIQYKHSVNRFYKIFYKLVSFLFQDKYIIENGFFKIFK